jgi:hypothetical protein
MISFPCQFAYKLLLFDKVAENKFDYIISILFFLLNKREINRMVLVSKDHLRFNMYRPKKLLQD